MSKDTPYLVGITGGIGAGKTTVSKVFKVLGAPLYNADERAKWLMENDESLRAGILDGFGKEAYHEDGRLNRVFLAAKVFSDSTQTEKINAMVHPAVGRDFRDWCLGKSYPYVLKEAALLFETGSYKDLDKVLLVTAPLETRIERVLSRDPQRTREQVLDIVEKQWDESKKRELSDFIVENCNKSMLLPQILKVHQKLLSYSEGKRA
ncbi:dephospho-CoA kinase [Pleomorphovibrio marinus]|uniref:dephospho-CoA kinase n=1 Tax=Pleomorphovibrio marinus TaxID=2164132 RepID=UPI000E0C5D4E|nr:dephospho-CoA kinase [Pleomorphovibrio marinus]